MTNPDLGRCATASIVLALLLAPGTDAWAQAAPAGTAPQEEHGFQFELGVMRDDNLTRANMRADRVDDNALFFGIRKPFNYGLTENSRLVFTGSLSGEKFRDVDGLSRVGIGAEVEYQYRASSRFDEPTYGVFLNVAREDYDSSQRDGNRVGVGVSLRRTLTDRIDLYAALAHERRNARNDVFSARDNVARGTLDFRLTDRALFYVGAEYRRGDIHSTGWMMMATPMVTDVWTMDDVFPGMVTYRLRGRTSTLTLGLNFALAPNQSLDLSWRHVRARPESNPTMIETSYDSNQISLVYLYRF